MLSVEAAMRFYAEKFHEDPNEWGNVGLLHDFDWEIHPTLEEHPQAGAPILRIAVCLNIGLRLSLAMQITPMFLEKQ